MSKKYSNNLPITLIYWYFYITILLYIKKKKYKCILNNRNMIYFIFL